MCFRIRILNRIYLNTLKIPIQNVKCPKNAKNACADITLLPSGHLFGTWVLISMLRGPKNIGTSAFNCFNDWGWKEDGQEDHTYVHPTVTVTVTGFEAKGWQLTLCCCWTEGLEPMVATSCTGQCVIRRCNGVHSGDNSNHLPVLLVNRAWHEVVATVSSLLKKHELHTKEHSGPSFGNLNLVS